MKRAHGLFWFIGIMCIVSYLLPPGVSLAEEGKIVNSIGMRFVLIPAGEFMMGSRESAESTGSNKAYCEIPMDYKRFLDEHPLHRVVISKPFYLQETEVTIAQFRKFVSETGYLTDAEREGWTLIADSGQKKKKEINWQDPGFPQGDNEPVVLISWNDAAAFVQWLNTRENTDSYTLPTDAQWEYANRAGAETVYYWGSLPDGTRANFADKSFAREHPEAERVNRDQDDGYVYTAPVASYPPNAFGLYDMSGNAYEWCNDWYSDYPEETVIDPQGPATGLRHVMRGGAWVFNARCLRSAVRRHFRPEYRNVYTGFRVARRY